MQRHQRLHLLSLLVLAFSAASAFPAPLNKVDHHSYAVDTSSVRFVYHTEDVPEFILACTMNWDAYKSYFGLMINNAEEDALRLDAFCKTAKLIVSKNNILFNASFRMGSNQFMAILPNEVLKFTGYLGSKASAEKHAAAKQFKQLDNYVIPTYNTPPGKLRLVLGLLGSGRARQPLQPAEEEERDAPRVLRVGADRLLGQGCGGGLMSSAFDYVKEAGGIEASRDYAYEGKDANCCLTKNKVVSDDSGFVAIPSGNEDALREAVARVGPVSVANTVTKSFFIYSDGVYYNERCDGQALNHGALLVGFGTDPMHGDYWLVKNSWGDKWGEKGYIRMARGKGKACGIAKEAVFPVIV